jgi:hypothetical protein
LVRAIAYLFLDACAIFGLTYALRDRGGMGQDTRMISDLRLSMGLGLGALAVCALFMYGGLSPLAAVPFLALAIACILWVTARFIAWLSGRA